MRAWHAQGPGFNHQYSPVSPLKNNNKEINRPNDLPPKIKKRIIGQTLTRDIRKRFKKDFKRTDFPDTK